MSYESISDIYSVNKNIRANFLSTISGITDDEAVARPDGEKWTIQQIIEHIALVETGISRICGKLLGEAKSAGKTSNGSFAMREEFAARTQQIAGLKVEAPDRVQPSGEMPISESIKLLEQSGEALSSMANDLAGTELSANTFPHPFLGELTAAEWLIMVGGHEARHTRQIAAILEKVRGSDAG